MSVIWKDIKNYEGLYQVSNIGIVKSLGNGKSNNSKERVLKPGKNKAGYLQVGLCKNGKQKMCKVHRLVAEAFLPNPENKPEVNHIDENKENNFVGTPENNYKDGNLEWSTHKENSNHGTRNERISKAQKGIPNIKLSKPVLQLSLSGELIKEWPSTAECGRNGFDSSNIARCCNGKLPHYKGFRWMYKRERETF